MHEDLIVVSLNSMVLLDLLPFTLAAICTNNFDAKYIYHYKSVTYIKITYDFKCAVLARMAVWLYKMYPTTLNPTPSHVLLAGKYELPSFLKLTLFIYLIEYIIIQIRCFRGEYHATRTRRGSRCLNIQSNYLHICLYLILFSSS